MGGFFYGKYTREQVEQANQADLEELLRRSGEKLLRSGKNFRLESDHSITVRGNRWYDYASAKGGFAVSFVRQHYGLPFTDAMKLLLGEAGAAPVPMARPRETVPPAFVLPKRNGEMRRAFGYLLNTRRLDRDVVSAFVRKGLLYEDAPYHNVVFLGVDEQGVPRHAQKRSTNSEGKALRLNAAGSDPAYSFHWVGIDNRLFVFEAPIDLLSYISLHQDDWQCHSYVALCGTAGHAMMKMLEVGKQIEDVVLCLDNDKAGHMAAERLAEGLEGYSVTWDFPQGKDWNDDLRLQMEQVQETGGMTIGL